MNKTIIRFIILISIFKITFFDFKGLSDQTEQLNDFQYLKIYNRMIYYSDFLSNKTKQNLLNINKSICKILLNK